MNILYLKTRTNYSKDLKVLIENYSYALFAS